MEWTDKELDVLKSFDKSIEKQNGRTKEILIAERKLFMLSKGLTIVDWKVIRGGDYWAVNDSMKRINAKGRTVVDELAQAKHLIKRIEEYLNK